jgi:dipeptidyl aminopeptidase/acylaminoacyl peptidase
VRFPHLLEFLYPIAIAMPGAAQAATRFVTLSADGTQVASFEPVQADAGKGSGTKAARGYRLVVRDAGTGAVRLSWPLCAGCQGSGLAIAPGGGVAVLALEPRSRTTSVTLVDAQGERPLSLIAGTAASPRWSPDGRVLGFLATIWPRKEPGAVQPGSPLTGEIGARVDVQRFATVPVEGGATRLNSPANLYLYDYDWLPDGSGVVATAADGVGDASWWSARLVALDLRSGGVRDIARPATQIAAPTMLADGRTVAFIGGLMSDRVSISGDVWTVPLAGGEPVDRTPGFAGGVTGLSRRGSGLVGTAVLGVKGAIVAIDPVRGAADAPLWSTPQGIEANSASFDARGEQMALVAQDFTTPPHLLAGPVGAPRDIASLAEEGAIPVAADVRSLEWERGGQRLQGWLLTPKAKAKGLVVEAHGGPVAVSLPDYAGDDLRGELLAAGYALFLPNPRGSAGRGEAFKALVRRDFGGGDLADILTGTTEAARAAGIASDRLAMLGTSYGGFLALLANGRTRLFRALIAGGGIADWQSYYGQNEIGGWMMPFFGASAYDDPAIYAAASPMALIRQAKTPTLLFVGERDIETPPAQSLQYWRGLRAMGVPTTLVIYPGEGHAIIDPKAVGDLERRILDWLDQWVAS